VSRSGLLRGELAPITIASLSTIALAAFDGVSVIAILPRITGDLGDVGFISWVITGFLVASTISVVVAGPMVDTLGVCTTFRITLIVFGVASVACAAAPNVPVLIAFRVLQGVGGGLVIAVALAAVGLVYPSDLVPRAYATISALWGAMAIVGPAVAAGLNAVAGWRAVFLVNVPLCILAGALAWSRFPGRRADAHTLRFDTTGIVLLGAFTVVSLVAVSWFSAWTVAGLVVAAVLAGAYTTHARRAAAPVLEPQFIAHMPLSGIHLASAAAFGGCLGVNAYLPLYVQAGLDHSSTMAAASVLFFSVGWSFGSIAVSRVLDRFRPVDVALTGFGLIVPPLFAGFVWFGSTTSLGLVWTLTLVEGLGVGLVSTSLLTFLQHEVDPSGMGRANAAHQYVRNLVYTYCAALVSAVVLYVVQRRVGDIDAVRDLLAGEDVETGAATGRAIASGYRFAHLVTLAVAALGVVAALRLRRFSRSRGHRTSQICEVP
jgi:MFS family permease